MADLTSDLLRETIEMGAGFNTSVPLAGLGASTENKIFKGGLVWGDSGTAGYAKEYLSTDTVAAGSVFFGVAEEQQKYTGTVDGSVQILCRQTGRVGFPLGALTQADIGKTVYATDAVTLTLTSTGNLKVGVLAEIRNSVAFIEIDGAIGAQAGA